jgi:hypothetical protein
MQALISWLSKVMFECNVVSNEVFGGTDVKQCDRSKS